MTQEFNFTTEFAEVPVTIDGKGYKLREASGAAAVQYHNATLNATRFSDGKLSAFSNLSDAEPLLVSLCLFDDQSRPVPIQKVKAWPSHIQKALFAEAKRISHLDEESPQQKALKKALALPDSPVSVEDLSKFVRSLEDKEFFCLRALFEDENSAKN